MTKVSSTEITSKTDVDLVMPELQLPDADSTADVAMSEGLDFCAQKMGLSGHKAAVDRLRQGNSTAYRYCHYGIAKHVAESLGALDDNVKAVYIVDYDATPEDVCFGAEVATPLLHLIVWAERKTSALNSLVQATDRALVQRYTEVTGARQLAHLLDVQVVDDKDIKNRVGYGAMLSSLHHRPIQVWER